MAQLRRLLALAIALPLILAAVLVSVPWEADAAFVHLTGAGVEAVRTGAEAPFVVSFSVEIPAGEHIPADLLRILVAAPATGLLGDGTLSGPYVCDARSDGTGTAQATILSITGADQVEANYNGYGYDVVPAGTGYEFQNPNLLFNSGYGFGYGGGGAQSVTIHVTAEVTNCFLPYGPNNDVTLRLQAHLGSAGLLLRSFPVTATFFDPATVTTTTPTNVLNDILIDDFVSVGGGITSTDVVIRVTGGGDSVSPGTKIPITPQAGSGFSQIFVTPGVPLPHGTKLSLSVQSALTGAAPAKNAPPFNMDKTALNLLVPSEPVVYFQVAVNVPGQGKVDANSFLTELEVELEVPAAYFDDHSPASFSARGFNSLGALKSVHPVVNNYYADGNYFFNLTITNFSSFVGFATPTQIGGGGGGGGGATGTGTGTGTATGPAGPPAPNTPVTPVQPPVAPTNPTQTWSVPATHAVSPAPATAASTAATSAAAAAAANGQDVAPYLLFVRADRTDLPTDEIEGDAYVYLIGARGVNATFAVYSQDGLHGLFGENQDSFIWDTVPFDNGPYTVEARRYYSGDLNDYSVIATEETLVENPRTTSAKVSAAVGIGAILMSTFAVIASSVGVRASAQLGELAREAALAVGEDKYKDATDRIAKFDWKLTSSAASLLALTLVALFFTIESMEAWILSEFVQNILLVGTVATLFFGGAIGLEFFIGRVSGARTKVKFLGSGALALGLSSAFLKTAFGYPGYVEELDDGEERDENPAHVEGLRAFAGLAGSLVFIIPAAWAGMRFDFAIAEEAFEIALVAIATSSLPFPPLPGNDIWGWRKAASIGAAGAGVGLYVLYQLAILHWFVYVYIGALGGLIYVVTIAWLWARNRPTPPIWYRTMRTAARRSKAFTMRHTPGAVKGLWRMFAAIGDAISRGIDRLVEGFATVVAWLFGPAIRLFVKIAVKRA